MANSNPNAESTDENQKTFDEYDGESGEEDSATCSICGITSENTTAIKQCHPRDRLKQERAAAVTTPDASHTGFGLPSHLTADVTEFLKRVKESIQASNDSNPLAPATTLIREFLPAATGTEETWQVFMHLVFLQQMQVLPGYPITTTTAETTRLTIREFCNKHQGLDGRIDETRVQESDLLEYSQMYRAKPLTTTDAFKTGVPGSTNPVYAWFTEIKLNVFLASFETNAVFNESTAHNAITIKARNWLTHHSDVDWATAPHQIGAGTLIQEKEWPVGKRVENPGTETQMEPSYMVDFAGFATGSPPELKVLGLVQTDYKNDRSEMNDDKLSRLFNEMTKISRTDAVGLIVLPSRKALYKLVQQIINILRNYDTPTGEDAAEYYSKYPNIQAVNEHLRNDIEFFESIWFITTKQLVDGIVTPEDVLGSTIRDPKNRL